MSAAPNSDDIFDDDFTILALTLGEIAFPLLTERQQASFNYSRKHWLADIFYDNGFEKEVWDNPAECTQWVNDLPGIALELVLDILAEKGF